MCCYTVSRAASSSLKQVKMKEEDWEVVDVGMLLRHLSQESPSFRANLQKACRLSKELKLLMYADGVTPGDGFAHDNKRKSTLWYISFLEFKELLAYEEYWMTLASARTKMAKDTSAGISGLTRRLLRDLFLTQKISEGVTIDGCIVCIKMHAILGDEEALNAMLHTKGASGTVPCATLCSVVNKQNSSDAELGFLSLAARSPLIQDISCSDINRIGLRSNEDVWSMCDSLRTLSGDHLKLRQQTTGFTYHKDALLFDMELRRHVLPASMTTVDPMHVTFSNGVMSSEVMKMMTAVKVRHGKYLKDLREYLQEKAWQVPWRGRRYLSLVDLVNEHREQASGEMLKVD